MKKAITATLAIFCTAAIAANSVQASAAVQETPDARESDEERVYCIASVSKVYATAAVMQLADRGLVDLDAPVTEYIPDFTMADPRYTDITVRMLMNHTSGIMGTTLCDEALYDDHAVDAERRLLDNLATQRLKADPGEYAAYCNDGFGLLQIIVGNVSGMSYTDYITDELAGPIGLAHTGTPENADRLGDPVSVYVGGLPNDYEYCMDFGSGGILATASDVARFGSSFFTGSDRLVSPQLAGQMKTSWTDSDDVYLDDCGLGWDYVEALQYEREGVQVLGKGGDVGTMHSFLMVAPDREISVAVLSSGGGSGLCEYMCEDLLNAALEEQGIEIKPVKPREVTIIGEVPAEFDRYAGYYSFNAAPATGLAKVSFPDHSSMLLEVVTFDGRNTETRFRYTDCGGFVEVSDSGQIRSDQRVLYFKEEQDGRVYIASEQYSEMAEMGSRMEHVYVGERVAENPVSDEVKAAWAGYCAVPFAAYNNRYSSTVYDAPFVFLMMPEDLPGYVLAGTGLGSRLLRIEDERNAVSFQTMPCTSNRDLIDLHVREDGTIDVTTGNSYVPLTAVPELTPDTAGVELTSDHASWFRIGDDMGFEVIEVDRPDDAVIYVYNKFFEPVYTTHYKDAGAGIDLPEDGYIVFLGQTGEKVRIN